MTRRCKASQKRDESPVVRSRRAQAFVSDHKRRREARQSSHARPGIEIALDDIEDVEEEVPIRPTSKDDDEVLESQAEA